MAATKDVESFKSSFRDPGVVVPAEEQLISEIAEPRHGKIRRIVNSAVATHRLGRVEPFTRAITGELLEKLLAKGGGESLSDVEVRMLMVFLLVAGNETTRNLIGNLLVTMCEQPSLFHELQAAPELIPIAVEESLRLDPPSAVLLRDCIRDTEVHGVSIKAGEKVAYGVASANRDESHYQDPDSFRLDRPDPKHHLAFGGGPHICPGSVLARMEARVAIEVFLENVSEMKLTPGYVRQKSRSAGPTGRASFP